MLKLSPEQEFSTFLCFFSKTKKTTFCRCRYCALCVILYPAFDGESRRHLCHIPPLALSQKSYYIILFCCLSRDCSFKLSCQQARCGFTKFQVFWKRNTEYQAGKMCIVLELWPAGHIAVKHNTLACQSGEGNLFCFIAELKALSWGFSLPAYVHMNTYRCIHLSTYSFFFCPSEWTIDSMLTIHKERRRETKMYFDPLCKCNETISPQAVQIVCSDFSPKKKKK